MASNTANAIRANFSQSDINIECSIGSGFGTITEGETAEVEILTQNTSDVDVMIDFNVYVDGEKVESGSYINNPGGYDGKKVLVDGLSVGKHIVDVDYLATPQS